jgi:glutathione synthase/RimK-type ligase-like ATP-grasp enzyme
MKVGILSGRENTFPRAFIDRVNELGDGSVTAEMVSIGGTTMADTIPYRLIVDRMSHEVPYYRAYVKKAVADGVIVINNPFWWSADDKFFECVLAEKLGVAVPKTVVLPNKTYEADIIDESLRNLQPIDWEAMVAYVGGFPTVLKPAIGGGWKNVTIAHSLPELLEAYDASGNLLMILQEFIRYENYSRCFVIGRRDVLVSKYDPSLGHFDRYVQGPTGLSDELHERVVRDCLTLCTALGYDMNTVEWAIRDGIPYAIDFLNPAPDFDVTSLGETYFRWVVDHMARLVIAYALGEDQPKEPDLLRWQLMMDAMPAVGAPSG